MENAKTNKLMKKLLAVQAELKAPKNQFNNFGNYAYRTAEGILEAVKPLLVKNGLTILISDDIENIGGFNYIKATVRIFDVETGEFDSASAYARESQNKKGQDDSQMTGACSSYARKYALNGLFLIDDTKDADSDEYHNQTGGGQPQRTTPQIEVDAYKREISEIYDITALKEWWKNANRDIPMDIKQEIYNYCKVRLNELNNKED